MKKNLLILFLILSFSGPTLAFKKLSFSPTDTMNLSNLNITDPSGLNFPSNLQSLYFSYNSLTNSSLANLNLPSGLELLDLSGNSTLTNLSLLNLPSSLGSLIISRMSLESLVGLNLPSGLEYLDISYTSVKSFAGITFPSGLKRLDIAGISNLDLATLTFPADLEELNISEPRDSFGCNYYAQGNKVKNIDQLSLPANLIHLNLANLALTSADLANLNLPDSLEILDLSSNNIENIDSLKFPSSLQYLYLSDNLLKDVKANLPPTLRFLSLRQNFISKKNKIAIRKRYKKSNLRLNVDFSPNIRDCPNGYFD